MINPIKFLAGIALLILTACSNQEIRQNQTEQPLPSDGHTPLNSEISPATADVPPMTTIKAGKDLSLVRAMEGGACKNEQQGVAGMFLLYADESDIERIKHTEGTQVFSEYKMNIETFSRLALQEAVQETDFTEDPLLDTNEAQQEIFQKLAIQFRIAVERSINAFQEETTLTIAVVPFASSFVLFRNDCEATHIHPGQE